MLYKGVLYVATTEQHNNIVKVCFDGNKHLNHVMSNKEIQNMTLIENRFPLTKLPVCGSCEKLALWSKGMQATCRSCGTITKRPITYSTYLASGMDVDGTGTTAKKVLVGRQELAEKNVLPYYDKLCVGGI